LQTELRQEASVLVIDVKKAELLAQKVLATHSTRMKVTFSELVVQTALDLRSPDIKARDRALALASLRSVCDRLYGWDREPDVREMERAKDYVINLELQNTPPEKLKELALASKADALEPVIERQDGGPSPNRPEHGGAGVGTRSRLSADGQGQPTHLARTDRKTGYSPRG
jgi:hypothetical protein